MDALVHLSEIRKKGLRWLIQYRSAVFCLQFCASGGGASLSKPSALRFWRSLREMFRPIRGPRARRFQRSERQLSCAVAPDALPPLIREAVASEDSNPSDQWVARLIEFLKKRDLDDPIIETFASEDSISSDQWTALLREFCEKRAQDCPAYKDLASDDSIPSAECVARLREFVEEHTLDYPLIVAIGGRWQVLRDDFVNEFVPALPDRFKQRLGWKPGGPLAEDDVLRNVGAIWFRPIDGFAIRDQSLRDEIEEKTAWPGTRWRYAKRLFGDPTLKPCWPDVDWAIKSFRRVCKDFNKPGGRTDFTPKRQEIQDAAIRVVRMHQTEEFPCTSDSPDSIELRIGQGDLELPEALQPKELIDAIAKELEPAKVPRERIRANLRRLVRQRTLLRSQFAGKLYYHEDTSSTRAADAGATDASGIWSRQEQQESGAQSTEEACARKNTTPAGAEVATKTVAERLAAIPPLDKADDKWVTQVRASHLERGDSDEVGTNYLKAARFDKERAIRSSNGTHGIDRNERMWRRDPEDSKSILYYIPTLSLQTSNNDK